MNEMERWKNLGVGLAGAVAGGVLGYFIFFWAARQGFYALILPGALAGMGGGLLVKDRSLVRGVLCGIFAVGLGLFSEWRLRPFTADESFSYFLSHTHQLQPLTWIMVLAGGGFGCWLALGKEKRPAETVR